MSKAATSPTARLLQTSRLFSLPKPLPPPPLEHHSSSGLYRGSDTATTLWPTHQAITTPQSSLSRGDFGLKRALPAKTTRNTTTPHVRIKAQDTYEHVTEFASAADHTQTREKWLEMGIPIKKAPAFSKSTATDSVFEEHLDNTDPEAVAALKRRLINARSRGKETEEADSPRRWKHQAPHIGGMPPGEFQKWLKSNITSEKKREWRAFLSDEMLHDRVESATQQARNEGRPLTAKHLPALRQKLTPSKEEVDVEEKRLRDDHSQFGLSSELSKHLTKFLDLPGIAMPTNIPTTKTQAMGAVVSDAAYGDTAPPTTHPSAGLSHLRTNAVMENHPIFGPQRQRTPVEARVLEARERKVGKSESTARLGVGGFVTKDSISATYGSQGPGVQDQAREMDPNLEGGNKIWVHPEYATVDDKGRVHVTVGRADKEPVAIKTKDAEAIRGIFDTKRAGLLGAWDGSGVRKTQAPNVQPFDFSGGVKDEQDAMRRIVEQANPAPRS